MKKTAAFTKTISLIAFCSFAAASFYMGASRPVAPGITRDNEKEHDDPSHPGWFSQLFEMKKGADGKMDWKLYRQVRRQVYEQRMEKGGSSNLTNIQELGPRNVGGRTRAFLVDHADKNHLFAGGVSGGLWESDDYGVNWHPVNDDVANLSVTFITQNPYNADIIYYSSGECAGNSAGIAGDGIYKSTDNGQTFSVLPATQNGDFDYVWRVVHSQVDSNTIYVGTRDHGLFRSLDGGASFENLLSGEITDVEVFADSSVLAGKYGTGIYYSPNGAPGTFTLLGGGLPAGGSFNRIEMAYCKNTPSVMYAAFENTAGTDIEGLYRSTDGGATWAPRSMPSSFGINYNFPWYCFVLEVKPDNPDFVVTGGTDMGCSNDGGNSWVPSWYSHADNHVVVFDPFDPDDFYVGNDGGIYRYNYLQHDITFDWLNNDYNVTQFYTGAFFPTGVKFWGGTQDNGTQSGTSANMNTDHIFGGDGAFTAVNQQSPSNAYVSWQNGHIYKCFNANVAFPDFIEVYGEMDANADGDIDDDTWFINPFEINREEGEQLYFVTRERLWRTIDGASSWEPATGNIANLYAVGVSNDILPVVYVGGTGKLFRLSDAVSQFPGDEVNISSSIPSVVVASFISCITVSPNRNDVFYVALSSYVNQPRIYKVTNGTTTPVWTSIHGDLPAGLPVNWVDVSKYSEDVMVIGTDFGVYTTINGGQNWVLEDAIPNVPVHQVKMRRTDNKVFIYTHGRGVWSANAPTTGMGVAQEEVWVNIYPTLVQDQVTIQSLEMIRSIDLISTTGAFMGQAQYNASQVQVQVGDLSPGAYYLRINLVNGRTVTRKIVKS